MFSVHPVRKPAFSTIYAKLMAFWMYMKKICQFSKLFFQVSYWMFNCLKIFLSLTLAETQIGTNTESAPCCVGVKFQTLQRSGVSPICYRSSCLLLSTSMAARFRFQACTGLSSPPGLSLCFQQVSAMQMDEGTAFVELASSG